ncbi:CHAT domain-containing protein [Cellulomonas sp. URHD0024]|uniref:CHAT domain-containing protein n=1 Tax=Cellulomonas sp. URHD0024 TaxID=1302620 RepID=UPI0012DD9584|nr:CHAT domain-containing protein [Cellulomonas sp. URHD0024]
MRSLLAAADVDPVALETEAAAAVAAARRRKDPEILGLSLRVLAMALRARMDDPGARRLLNEAVHVARRHELHSVAAGALVTRATVLQELGRVNGSMRDLDAALAAISRATDIEAGERARVLERILVSRAVVAQNAGMPAVAEARYRALLAGGVSSEFVGRLVHNNLALALAERGAYDQALEQADAAVAMTADAPGFLGPVLQTRAWIAVRAGRLAQGLVDFERSAQAHTDAGVPLGEYYYEYADAMVDLRLLPEATSAAERAVEELVSVGSALMATEAKLRLAHISLLTGNLEAARDLADAAADEARRQHRAGWRDKAVLVGVEARLRLRSAGVTELRAARRAARNLERAGHLHSAVEAYLVAGRLALDVDRPRDAVPTLVRAHELGREGQVLVRLRGRLAAALADRARRRSASALVQCRAGLRDLAVHRSNLPTIELRALASGHGAELGEIGLGIVLETGSPAQTLAWMERTRAAALTARFPRSVDAVVERRTHTQEQAASSTGRSVVTTETADDHRIRTAEWARSVEPVVDPAQDLRPMGLTALRAELAGATLVELGTREGRLVAVVVEPRQARLVELGAAADVQNELRPLLFALRRLANPRSPQAADAARASADLRIARLRSILVAPLGVDADAELVVVPVGLLHGVPWSCLHDGPLTQAPSATIWVRTRRAALARPGQGATVLVAGPGLEGAREEVEALVDLHPGATVLEPSSGTAAAVVAALADADLAHLACHGTSRTDNPMFSSLLLADGPVTVQELHGAGVAPHRLVLASCHSGADVAYLGDEVLGFVSAMLAQGTAGVVASIAAVPDVAAVDLMLELHRGLREGLTLARALHAARGRIDRDSPEGFVNWCTFSAHGAA